MKTLSLSSEGSHHAFTLVELMVTTALLSLLMLLLVGTVDQTQRIFKRTSEKTTQFQSARSAFQSMTARLSQATLNTYWRAHEVDPTSKKATLRFRRQSELQFISAPSTRFFGSTPELSKLSSPIEKCYPTDAVFFQAPLGYSEERNGSSNEAVPSYRNLNCLLGACGYFVEFGPETDRPHFVSGPDSTIPNRYRFRLKELMVPAEQLTIYQRPVTPAADLGFIDPRIYDRNNRYYEGMTTGLDRKSNAGWVRPLWMEQALRRGTVPGLPVDAFSFSHVSAENIIALVILPKLAEKDRVVPGTSTLDANQLELAPRYEFDSWRVLSGGTTLDADGRTQVDNTARDNLLPPIVQVTMVAVDEPSMARLNLSQTKVPVWTQGLFVTARTMDAYRTDMKELERRLQADPVRLNYRIFTTDILLRASKWSRDPQ